MQFQSKNEPDFVIKFSKKKPKGLTDYLNFGLFKN